MQESVVILINDEATKTDELFLNKSWKLVPIFNKVYSVDVGGEKLKWLVKVYDKQRHAKKESSILDKLKNVEGVPKVLAVSLSDSISYVILSEAPGQDLFEYINTNGIMTENEIRNIAEQLLSILYDVHAKKIIHKDLKPENVVYDQETGKVTLIDFEEKFTADYCSPEQVEGEKVTTKTDMWSLGVLLYFLATGDVPFEGDDEILIAPLKLSKKVFGKKFRDFLRSLLERDVDLRYDVEDALTHDWVNGI